LGHAQEGDAVVRDKIARVLLWVQARCEVLIRRLHYPPTRFYRCPQCGGPTAMVLPDRLTK
jgi:hypothetical protein